LLTKLGLAQFTSGLFWRFGEQWHPAVNIFDALSPHTVAAGYTRPIHTTRHNALSRNTRATQQSRRRLLEEDRRLRLSAPNDASAAVQWIRQHRRGCRTGGPSERAHSSPVRPGKHTPALRGLVQNGLIHNPYRIPAAGSGGPSCSRLAGDISPTYHPALRRLRSLRSMWGLRLRSLLHSLRNLASADCASSGQVVSRDDVLQRFRGQRHRNSIG